MELVALNVSINKVSQINKIVWKKLVKEDVIRVPYVGTKTAEEMM